MFVLHLMLMGFVQLVLNEQFMISAHDPVDDRPSGHLTNKVIKILSVYGGFYKTFGENIILLINREGNVDLSSSIDTMTDDMQPRHLYSY